jgi:K+-sensing histidine kinase KdpD
VRRLPATGDRQIVVVRDENAIEAGRGMRDRILANLSHEFQTPLSAQVASIELLREHLRTTPDKVALQLADAQYRGTIRLSQLVDNLLDSVRIESGEMRLRRQHIDLTSIVADAMELMRPLIEQRDQRIVSQLPEGPTVVADGPRLLSVVVNLLANANKFAPDQTTLWVEMQWRADEVTIWVEDEGPGLPATSSPSDLFAPFRRSPHEEPSERGSGLGLAIVHAIVAAHGGQVIVAAPRQHRGARIGIALPLEAKA